MATLLLYCLLFLDVLLPKSNITICVGQHDLAKLGKLAKGRAMLLVLKEGMTEQQVQHLLGRPDVIWVSGWVSGVATASYSGYGLNVWYDFSSPERKVTHVDVRRLVASLE